MSDMLPWMVTPRNKKEMDEFYANMDKMVGEFYARSQQIAAEMNARLVRPKGGSKWARRLSFMRIDVKAWARSVTKPIANAAGGAVAISKAYRLSYARYHSALGGGSGGLDGGGPGYDFS